MERRLSTETCLLKMFLDDVNLISLLEPVQLAYRSSLFTYLSHVISLSSVTATDLQFLQYDLGIKTAYRNMELTDNHFVDRLGASLLFNDLLVFIKKWFYFFRKTDAV